MSLSQAGLDSFDEDDDELDQLLESMPRPLKRSDESESRRSPSTPSRTSVKFQSRDTPLSPIISLEERARRAEAKGRVYPHLSNVTDVSHLGWFKKTKKKLVKHSMKQYVAGYFPCLVCPEGSTGAMALGGAKSDDTIVVQYLGVNVKHSADLDRINKSEFVPYNHSCDESKKSRKSRKRRKLGNSRRVTNAAGREESNGAEMCSKTPLGKTEESSACSGGKEVSTDEAVQGDIDPPLSQTSVEESVESKKRGTIVKQSADGWSSTLFDMYRKYLVQNGSKPVTRDSMVWDRRPVFWDKNYERHYTDSRAAWRDYWFQIEKNFLANVLSQVQQQQYEAHKILLLPSPVNEVSSDDDLRIEHDHSQGPEEQAATDLLGNSDRVDAAEKTAFVKKLRAGDEIEYYPAVSVVSAGNARVARIFCVHGKIKSATSLELDNHQFVDVSSMICLRKRFLRGELVQVDCRKTMAVEAFALDQSMNGRVDFLRSKTESIFSKELVEEAWQASEQQETESNQESGGGGNPAQSPEVSSTRKQVPNTAPHPTIQTTPSTMARKAQTTRKRPFPSSTGRRRSLRLLDSQS